MPSGRDAMDGMPATLSTQLIDALFAQRRAGIPAAIRRKTRLHIADNLAIATAARETSALARQLPWSFQTGGQLAPAMVAFVMSAYGHILDFDDIHDFARVHPTAVTLPAALAAARAGGASGADVVDAVALSNELLCRLGSIWRPIGRGPGSDWFLSQLFGYFAAALSACIVLRMNAENTRSALGLAYMQAAGGKEAGFGVGGNARAIYPAFASMGGVNAALLALAGVVGPPTALDGAAGFFPLYFGRNLDSAQRAQLLRADAWMWSDTCIKPWPSCRISHPYVYAAQRLREDMGRDRIERIVISVNGSAAKLCAPLAQRLRPQTLQDAKYSIPFMVAFTLVHGEVSLNTLTDASLHDAHVLDMAQRIELVQVDTDEPGLPPAAITLYGGGASRTVAGPFNPPDSEDAVRTKFRSCFDFAGLGASAHAAWIAVDALDQGGVGDLLELMRVEPVGQS
ncbi:MmgE/PrpD family protein [Verticiella sediminum]|uniref:MmgE/PrpD family protein n=2 Tax=Verticiella sediminum TaxID=1247510 RepID=A0A556AIF3_9BURK|nr:MmgE/PrpD family protein [Verticiella sediminum]